LWLKVIEINSLMENSPVDLTPTVTVGIMDTSKKNNRAVQPERVEKHTVSDMLKNIGDETPVDDNSGSDCLSQHSRRISIHEKRATME